MIGHVQYRGLGFSPVPAVVTPRRVDCGVRMRLCVNAEGLWVQRAHLRTSLEPRGSHFQTDSLRDKERTVSEFQEALN